MSSDVAFDVTHPGVDSVGLLDASLKWQAFDLIGNQFKYSFLDTLGWLLNHQVFTLPPANLVQSTLLCCPAPIPIT